MRKIFLLLVVMFFCNVAKPSEPLVVKNISITGVQQFDFESNLKETCRVLLEKFCYDFYYIGFDRYFKPGSIYVTDTKVDDSNLTIYATGTHSYYGKSYGFGRKEHQGTPFIVSISFIQSGLRVIFKKWYEPDLLYPNGKWETIDKIIPLNYGSRY